MSRTLAVIPASAGSKRVLGKNTRVFAGKSLIQWTLEFACAYPGFDEVLISTDCQEVARVAKTCGKPLP
ncbi:cytidylyltransferase domain-containing protein [Pseudomonas peli]|uniref:cytidylyltransferase domain-containing protein n=1 Tax=Pseudomonas peli TaxID=592361 RepID=UPI003D31FD05